MSLASVKPRTGPFALPHHRLLMISAPTLDPMALAVCRWEWCRATFTSQDELVEHVLEEHVARAVPVKRHDIPINRRADEGYSGGESVLPTLGYSQTQPSFLTPSLPSTIDSKEGILLIVPNIPPASPRPSTPSPHREFAHLAHISSPTPDPSPPAQSPALNELVAGVERDRAARTTGAADGMASTSLRPPPRAARSHRSPSPVGATLAPQTRTSHRRSTRSPAPQTNPRRSSRSPAPPPAGASRPPGPVPRKFKPGTLQVLPDAIDPSSSQTAPSTQPQTQQSQAPVLESQTQWPLQTQAPYVYPTQSDLFSQSQ